MLHRLIRWVSLVCCTLIVISFGLFAISQLSGASAHQVSELVAGVPQSAQPPGSTPPAHRPEQQPRRFIDGAAHLLGSPFAGIVPSDSTWITRSVPALIGLLVYGLGLGYLARYSRGLS